MEPKPIQTSYLLEIWNIKKTYLMSHVGATYI